MKKDIAVLGLGIFGYRLATSLFKLGHSVLAVDKNPQIVDQIKEDVTEAIVADVTDHSVLVELSIDKFDTVILGMSNDFEQAVLTLADLKKLNVKHIIAKANRKIHEEILFKVGANEVILPEREMADKLAYKIDRPGVGDMLSIDSDISLVNIKVPDKLDGKSLMEIDLRKNYGLNAVMIKRKGEKAGFITTPQEILRKGDELLVIGDKSSIGSFLKKNT
jgi:trk system potassium uptake protein TrkA